MAAPIPDPQKPDILLLMFDQFSAKWLEAAFAGCVPLPNLRRLAENGTSFPRTFCSNPVCSPSRATLATGLTSRGHGLLENGYELDPAIPTFMQQLQQSGWKTAAFGKLHFQPHFKGFDPDYHPHGFDVTHITEDGRGGEWLDWVKTEHPEHYESVLATIWSSHIPAYSNYGIEGENLKERIQTIQKNFQGNSAEHPGDNPSAYVLPFPKEVSQTEWITGQALDFLERSDPKTPLFAQVSYVQPHGPFCPPEVCLDKVDTGRIPEPAPAEWVEDSAAPRYFDGRVPLQSDWRHYRQYYFADLCHLDKQIGKLFDAVERRGKENNTYILFVSDHGVLLGDHGFRGKAERHYDACVRVPLIISGPGLQTNRRNSAIVQLEDICPTVLEMAGLEMPPMPKLGRYLKLLAEEIPRLPGHSLLGACRDGSSPPPRREHAYIESYSPIAGFSPGDWARTLRTRRFRYTYYPCEGGEQLFDLKYDPDEQVNLARQPEWQSVRRQLKDELMEQIILQDYPKTRRSLFALGVH
ncbi:MAG: sulfatase-like hydrolase/transferase [Kiritimatiellae bacterium]|nr:sulfatase-like hydrolase/transferase [Kiritimatiellia bacterium]